MKSGKFWLAILVSGVVMNIVDFVFQGMVMESMYYSKHADVFTMTASPIWYILMDFVSVFVLGWVYDKVSGSFSAGIKGGAMFGLYAGILVSFPSWIGLHLFLKGFSYKYAWFSTIYGVVWGVVAAAIIAALYKKGTPAATT